VSDTLNMSHETHPEPLAPQSQKQSASCSRCQELDIKVQKLSEENLCLKAELSEYLRQVVQNQHNQIQQLQAALAQQKEEG
jgi:dsDNA-specific endonuclease/ATPase MutS2